MAHHRYPHRLRLCVDKHHSTLNTSVQLAVPAWVQARALGTYLMTFQGGMALGSVLWGSLQIMQERPKHSSRLPRVW